MWCGLWTEGGGRGGLSWCRCRAQEGMLAMSECYMWTHTDTWLLVCGRALGVCVRTLLPLSMCCICLTLCLGQDMCMTVGHGPSSNPSTSAQVHNQVILSLPSSACCSSVVFSSVPLFVLARRHEVKPSVSGWLEIPVPTVLNFQCWGETNHLVSSCFLATFSGSTRMLFFAHLFKKGNW